MSGIRLLKPWRTWSAGHVFTDMPDGQASVLKQRGLAEDVGAASAPARKVLTARNYVTKGAGQKPAA